MEPVFSDTPRGEVPPALPDQERAMIIGASAQAESQEQLRRWLESLGGKIEQLGVDAGNLRNRLASMQGTYITQPEAIGAKAGKPEREAFGLLVANLLSRVHSTNRSC